MHIRLDDVDHANLLLHMDGAVKYIQAATAAGGTVLVHCAAGISRSATVRTLCLTQRFVLTRMLAAILQLVFNAQSAQHKPMLHFKACESETPCMWSSLLLYPLLPLIHSAYA